MPSTPGGIVYPLSTDPPNGAAQMQALAESAETGNPWVTSGFVVAANWTLSAFRIRRIGALVFLRLDVVRAVSAVTVAAGTGDIANLKLGDLPAGYWPAQTQALAPGPAGRVAGCYVQADGSVILSAVAGDGANIIVGDTISTGGCYVLG